MRFHSGEIAVQERAGVRAEAEEVGESIIDRIPPAAAEFLGRRQMAVLGTVDAQGHVWASVVTGAPGFIETLDARTVRIAASPPPGDPILANLATEGHVAAFFPDFATPKRVRTNGRGLVKDGKIYITTEEVYGNCRRYMQERLFVGPRQSPDTDRASAAPGTTLSPAQQAQISRADTFFIASDHPDRGADVSHKGGKPGFVSVIDDRQLSFPDYNGNRMFNTLGNIAVNPHAGLLFIDFEGGRTLQLSGVASIDWNPERARLFAGAERVIDFELLKLVDTPMGFALITKFRQFSRFNP